MIVVKSMPTDTSNKISIHEMIMAETIYMPTETSNGISTHEMIVVETMPTETSNRISTHEMMATGSELMHEITAHCLMAH